jgi:23S rRNA pseudouridine955/2504/2580 synthase
MTMEKVRTVLIDEDSAGQRLDNFLLRELKGVPKSKVYRVIRRGEVRINGGRAKPLQKLKAGDRVRIPPVRQGEPGPAAVGSFQDLDALILFEDSHLLILNKPAGMAVHGGSGVQAGVIESLRHALPREKHLELVHRLDRGTSGCLMVAKKRKYLKLLQDALRQPGRISKFYQAVVHGAWPDTLDAVDQNLLTVSRSGQERFTRVDPVGKPALTTFRVIARAESLSWIEASPKTGRTHQIRVHARWARYPIVGDDRYGDQARDELLAVRPRRMLLHAHRLVIPAMDDRPAIEVAAPLDQRFSAFTEKYFH